MTFFNAPLHVFFLCSIIAFSPYVAAKYKLHETKTLPAGCTYIGSPQYELDRNNDEKKHRVCLTSFEISDHEVTVKEFKTFVEATGYITDAEINYQKKGCWSFDAKQTPSWNWFGWANWKMPTAGKNARNDDPVTCISFYDITQYIQWLNQISGEHYRLPTEAEWEYAARAGTSSTYTWGNNPRLACQYANIADQSPLQEVIWPAPFPCQDMHFFSAPVKSYRPNKFGLYDMLGNVWEWTCSIYEPHFNGSQQACSNILPLDTHYLAVRGGGWNADPARARLSYRNWEAPWVRMATWGFRLVKEKKLKRISK